MNSSAWPLQLKKTEILLPIIISYTRNWSPFDQQLRRASAKPRPTNAIAQPWRTCSSPWRNKSAAHTQTQEEFHDSLAQRDAGDFKAETLFKHSRPGNEAAKLNMATRVPQRSAECEEIDGIFSRLSTTRIPQGYHLGFIWNADHKSIARVSQKYHRGFIWEHPQSSCKPVTP
jgi:hypothetical protein